MCAPFSNENIKYLCNFNSIFYNLHNQCAPIKIVKYFVKYNVKYIVLYEIFYNFYLSAPKDFFKMQIMQKKLTKLFVIKY